MKHTKTLMLIFGLLFIATSCSPTLNYLGKSYSPTQNVDLYFEQADIKKEYTVMGRINNEAGEFESDDVEEVQKLMVEKAKSVGADAVLFLGFYTDKINGENNIEHLSDDKQTVYGNSNVNRSKQIQAKFLKYSK